MLSSLPPLPYYGKTRSASGVNSGPLLFMLYVNDLFHIPNSPELVIYADDTNVFFAAHTLLHIQNTTND